jgi:hypothetical protein
VDAVSVINDMQGPGYAYTFSIVCTYMYMYGCEKLNEYYLSSRASLLQIKALYSYLHTLFVRYRVKATYRTTGLIFIIEYDRVPKSCDPVNVISGISI